MSAIEIYAFSSAGEDAGAFGILPTRVEPTFAGGILLPGLLAVFLAVSLLAGLSFLGHLLVGTLEQLGYREDTIGKLKTSSERWVSGDRIKLIRQLAALLLFVWTLGIGLRASWRYVAPELAFVRDNLHLSYDEKMQIKWGDYYEYMVFVRENTPAGATIIIPPQGDQWPTTGNSGLDSYFLYPRRLVGMDQMPEAAYVLVVQAEDGSGEIFPTQPLPPGSVVWWRSGWGLLELP